jgi:hypothetical protein
MPCERELAAQKKRHRDTKMCAIVKCACVSLEAWTGTQKDRTLFGIAPLNCGTDVSSECGHCSVTACRIVVDLYLKVFVLEEGFRVYDRRVIVEHAPRSCLLES